MRKMVQYSDYQGEENFYQNVPYGTSQSEASGDHLLKCDDPNK